MPKWADLVSGCCVIPRLSLRHHIIGHITDNARTTVSAVTATVVDADH